MMMDLTTMPRSMAKLEYAAVRLPFALLDDRVIARHWDEDASLRVGFERFLGSLDEFAGLLLADDEILRRGRGLMRRTEHVRHEAGPPAATEEAPAERAAGIPAAGMPTAGLPTAGVPADLLAGDVPAAGMPTAGLNLPAAGVRADVLAAGVPAGIPTAGLPPADVPGADIPADVFAADVPPAGLPAAEPPDTSTTSATKASTVDVAFTLPAEVEADSVALCGDFNDWSAETISAERADDGTWQVTVALEPGRSYRYRYLLDGERWENARQADRYAPNAFGSVDSVVVVE